jgi:predicted TIM-barrel enzyme
MKKETVVTKDELQLLLLEHIEANELTEIDSVTLADGKLTVSLEDIELSSDAVIELLAKAMENPPDKTTLVILPDGSLGLQEDITLR